MSIFRIYTEDINRDGIESAMKHNGFEGYNLSSVTGFWRGTQEPALVIEVITGDRKRVQAAADEIQRVNKQESVGVVEIPSAYSAGFGA